MADSKSETKQQTRVKVEINEFELCDLKKKKRLQSWTTETSGNLFEGDSTNQKEAAAGVKITAATITVLHTNYSVTTS